MPEIVYSFAERASVKDLAISPQMVQEPSATAPTRLTPVSLVRYESMAGDLGVASLLFFMFTIIPACGSFVKRFLRL